MRIFSIYFSDAFDFSFLQHALHLLSLGSCRDCLLTLLLLLVLPACPLCPPIAQFRFRFIPVSTVPKTLGMETKQVVVRGPTRGARRGWRPGLSLCGPSAVCCLGGAVGKHCSRYSAVWLLTASGLQTAACRPCLLPCGHMLLQHPCAAVSVG